MGTLGVVSGSGGRAGAGSRAVHELLSAVRSQGWDGHELAVDELADAVSEGVERVALCGGDGLLHLALPHLARTGVEVAIVPMGTGNDFARAFDVDDDGAVDLAIGRAAAEVRDIDLLRAGEHWAASVVTGGYSGRVTETANALRFPRGALKYTVAALLEIGRLGGKRVRLVVTAADGSETVIDDDLALFAIGNTAWFGGGMQVLPAADPADGQLDVLTIDAVDRFTFARWLPRVFRGSHTDHRAVRVARGVSVRAETDEHLWADGEPFVPPPTTITLEAGALRLVTPERRA